MGGEFRRFARRCRQQKGDDDVSLRARLHAFEVFLETGDDEILHSIDRLWFESFSEITAPSLNDLEVRYHSIRAELWCQPTSHTSNEDYLYTSQSRIEGAGDGLFTSRSIPAFADVCSYEGFTHNFSSAAKIKDQSYLLKLGPCALDENGRLFSKSMRMRQNDFYTDAKACVGTKARHINDCLNQKGYNVVFVQEPDRARARVIALRRILPGEEIFVSYGEQYWQSLTTPRKCLSDDDLSRIIITP